MKRYSLAEAEEVFHNTSLNCFLCLCHVTDSKMLVQWLLMGKLTHLV